MLRFPTLLHLYRVRVRSRAVQEVLALVGIAAGVALVFTALIANSSLVGSTEQLTAGIVGDANYQIAGRGGQVFDASILSEVRQVPGVRVAAPVLDLRAILIGAHGRKPVTLMGVDSQLARLDGALLRQFKAVDMSKVEGAVIAVPLARRVGVTPGGTVTIQTGAHTARGVPTLTLPESALEGLRGSPVVVAALPYAQRISGIGIGTDVTRVLVESTGPNVRAALERIVGPGLFVRSSDAEVDVFKQAATPVSQSTTLFSLFAMLVGFLFAFASVLLTVPQRQRFIADLRLAGHPPRAVMQVMLFDALVLGAAGAAVGLVVGDLLSRGLFSAVPGYLSFAFPISSQRVVTWSSVALAAASGIFAATIAVLAPLRDIFSRRPTAGKRSAGHGGASVRVGAGLLCLLGAGVVTALAPVAAILGLVLLTAALLLLLPDLVLISVAGLDHLGRHIRSPVPALAVMELRSSRTRARTYALAATAAIAVFASVSISGAQSNLEQGLFAAQHDLDRNGDIWITFPGEPNTFATTPLSTDPATIATVARTPGVDSVSAYRGGFLDVGNRRVWVLGPPGGTPMPIPESQVTAGEVTDAAREMRKGGVVALSAGVADVLGVRVGDTVRLPSPVPIALRVAALTTNLGWPPGTAIMSTADFARAWGTPAPTALLVHTPPSRSAAVASSLRGRMDVDAPLTVETMDERKARQHAASRQGLARTTQISTIVLWTAILALATATTGILWHRRPTIARLKLDGMTQLQLWKALLLECTVLLGVGCIAGALFAFGGQEMLTRGLVAITDFPVVSSPGVALAAQRVAIVLTVALAILAVPGWAVVRVRPSAGRVS